MEEKNTSDRKSSHQGGREAGDYDMTCSIMPMENSSCLAPIPELECFQGPKIVGIPDAGPEAGLHLAASARRTDFGRQHHPLAHEEDAAAAPYATN